MADVFISYSKADREIAEALADDLRTRGFDVWWDHELYAGDDFHDMILSEIMKAKATLVIWSERAVASRWVRGEADEAANRNTLVSSSVPGFDTRIIPLNFRAYHCEPVENRDRIAAAIERKCAHTQDSVAATTTNVARPGDPVELDDIFMLAVKNEHGQDLPKNEQEAIRLYRLAAERGSTHAFIRIGEMFRLGRGVERDFEEAARCYARGAALGDSAAQVYLGRCYRDGQGVQQDDHEAVRQFQLAAEQDHWGAKFYLGEMYEEGRGVEQSFERAAELYQPGATVEDPEANFRLGRFYKHGLGVPQDVEVAMKYFHVAAKHHHKKAKSEIS